MPSETPPWLDTPMIRPPPAFQRRIISTASGNTTTSPGPLTNRPSGSSLPWRTVPSRSRYSTGTARSCSIIAMPRTSRSASRRSLPATTRACTSRAATNGLWLSSPRTCRQRLYLRQRRGEDLGHVCQRLGDAGPREAIPAALRRGRPPDVAGLPAGGVARRPVGDGVIDRNGVGDWQAAGFIDGGDLRLLSGLGARSPAPGPANRT